MKNKRYLLAGLIAGLLMGWALGFLRLPYLEKNDAFGLGFVTALTLVALLLLTAWNSHFLSALQGNIVASDKPRAPKRIRWVWVATVLLGTMALGSAVWQGRAALRSEIKQRDQKILELSALTTAMQQYDTGPLMRSLLEDIGRELKIQPARMLSDSMMDRIAALSFSFKTFRRIDQDTLSAMESSPGRGQLLQALVLLNLHPNTFAKIRQQTVFDGADLRGADLKGLDLRNIRLKGANLEEANLSGTNLRGAVLAEANLWGAQLNGANLSDADLKKADLRWAQLNEAVLANANLTGANLLQAQLRKADLNKAIFQWAKAEGTLFNDANLSRVDFAGTNFSKVNLSRANLSYTDLRKTVLTDANLTDAQLYKALVDKDWVEKLRQWQPSGLNDLLKNYTVVNDTANQFKVPLYRLVPPATTD